MREGLEWREPILDVWEDWSGDEDVAGGEDVTGGENAAGGENVADGVEGGMRDEDVILLVQAFCPV